MKPIMKRICLFFVATMLVANSRVSGVSYEMEDSSDDNEPKYSLRVLADMLMARDGRSGNNLAHTDSSSESSEDDASYASRSVHLARKSIQLSHHLRQSDQKTKLDVRGFSVKHLDLKTDPGNDRGSYYTVRISIGTPPQPFDVVIDTGSDDLWVASAIQCTSPNNFCAGKHLFNSTASTTFQNLNQPADENYLGPKANGAYGADVVSLGGFQFRQKFGVMTYIDDVENVDGVIGLQQVAYNSSTTLPFSSLCNQNKGSVEPIFSIYLAGDTSKTPAGTLSIGGTDPTKYVGTIQYFPTQGMTTWWVWIQSMKVGSQALNLQDRNFQFLFDSGQPGCSGPKTIVAQMRQLIGAKFQYVFNNYLTDCSDAAKSKLPIITLTIHGVNFLLNPTQYLVQADFLEPFNPTTCTFLFYEHSDDAWYLGDTFFRRFYTTYNTETQQIGMANSVDYNYVEGATLIPTPISTTTSIPTTTPTRKNCGECYDGTSNCCNTCKDVINNYRNRHWAYSRTNFVQCQ